MLPVSSSMGVYICMIGTDGYMYLSVLSGL